MKNNICSLYDLLSHTIFLIIFDGNKTCSRIYSTIKFYSEQWKNWLTSQHTINIYLIWIWIANEFSITTNRQLIIIFLRFEHNYPNNACNKRKYLSNTVFFWLAKVLIVCKILELIYQQLHLLVASKLLSRKMPKGLLRPICVSASSH